jgi:hypothetical protein
MLEEEHEALEYDSEFHVRAILLLEDGNDITIDILVRPHSSYILLSGGNVST